MDGGIEKLPVKAVKIIIVHEGKCYGLDFMGPFSEDGFADFYIQAISLLKSIGFIRPADSPWKPEPTKAELKEFDELITRMWGKTK